jgi:hypothetical protein
MASRNPISGATLLRRIFDPERSRRGHGGAGVGKPKADLAIDQPDHNGLASAE